MFSPINEIKCKNVIYQCLNYFVCENVVYLCEVEYFFGQIDRMSTIGYGRSSALETYVRGQWYKVFVTLEDDYLCISLDETYENCTPVNGSLNNNTLGKVNILIS